MHHFYITVTTLLFAAAALESFRHGEKWHGAVLASLALWGLACLLVS